jgi:hypothetical protein
MILLLRKRPAPMLVGSGGSRAPGLVVYYYTTTQLILAAFLNETQRNKREEMKRSITY